MFTIDTSDRSKQRRPKPGLSSSSVPTQLKKIITLLIMDKRRLKVFENSIQRRIFEPKRDENVEWRRLHNEELHSLHL